MQKGWCGNAELIDMWGKKVEFSLQHTRFSFSILIGITVLFASYDCRIWNVPAYRQGFSFAKGLFSML